MLFCLLVGIGCWNIVAIDMGIRTVVEGCLDQRCAIVVHCDRIPAEEMAILMLEEQKRIVESLSSE